jgi:hypothetical protein
MKTRSRLGWLIALGMLAGVGKAADLTLPILTTQELAVVDSGTGDGPQFKYLVSVRDASEPQSEYYNVGFRVVPASSGRPLRAAATRINFLAAESISSNNQEYRDGLGDNWIYLPGFDEAREVVGAEWRYIDIGPSTPPSFTKTLRTITEFFIGFRFTADDGSHYGWMQLNRPDTHFLTFFQLTAWDWNPLPGEPIGAGLPPVIPLTPQVTAEGLRLSWPAAVAAWTLEASDQLGPAAQWSPVPGVSGTEVVLAPPATSRFFRLRKP